MIKLKTEVNESQVMREMKLKALLAFENAWEREKQMKAYMDGVRDLFKKLRKTKV